jgi:hypothetical protein
VIGQADAIADARPAGPCATYPAEDTTCDEPYSDGVVLIGDAGGYSDPITGQGLSMAMHDVRVLSELLLASDDWSRDALAPFGAEKRERMRRVKFIAEIMATLFADFVPEAHGRRLEALTRMQQDVARVVAGVPAGRARWCPRHGVRGADSPPADRLMSVPSGTKLEVTSLSQTRAWIAGFSAGTSRSAGPCRAGGRFR